MRALLLFILFSPLFVLLGISIYTNTQADSKDNILITGKCLETFREEHWGKSGPPTYTVYTVVRKDHNLYLFEGQCKSEYSMPWEKAHPNLYNVGIVGTVVWVIIAFCFAIFLIILWICMIQAAFKYKPGSFKRKLKEIIDRLSS